MDPQLHPCPLVDQKLEPLACSQLVARVLGLDLLLPPSPLDSLSPGSEVLGKRPEQTSWRSVGCQSKKWDALLPTLAGARRPVKLWRFARAHETLGDLPKPLRDCTVTGLLSGRNPAPSLEVLPGGVAH